MSRRAWLAFAALSLIWGVPYLFIKVAVDGGVSPFFLAWARLMLGAALLFALVPRQGLEMLRRGPRRWILAYATVEMVLPFPLIAAGEQHVDSSVAAIVIATVPLLIALLALRFDHTERPTRTRMLGMLIGLAGVMALVGIDLSANPGEVLGAAAIMVAAFGYAAGPMIIKRHLLSYDPRATMAASLTVAAILLTPAGLITFPGSTPPTDAIASLIVLGVVCTATAFVILMVLVSEVGAGRASIITYVNPVIAVALGVAILGESPGAGAIAGLLLILAGSWLSTDDRLPPNPTAIVTRWRGRRRPPAAPEPYPQRMRARVGLIGVLAAVASLGIPAGASGATATIGSTLALAPANATCGTATFTNTALASPVKAPFDGFIVRWRMSILSPDTNFTYQLRVLQQVGASYKGDGTGPPQTAPSAGVNVIILPTPLPIHQGELIAIDCPEDAPSPLSLSAPGTSTFAFFSPLLADGQERPPSNQLTGEEMLINADIATAPSNAFTLGKVKRNRHRGTATIPVTVPGPGTLALAGKGIKGRSITATGAVTLKLKATGKAKRTLASRGSAKVRAKITFTPTGEVPGSPSTQTVKLKLIET